jgi:hypothetical protein
VISPDEQQDREWERTVVREVDAILHRGDKPDVDALAARWPDHADRVRTIVAIRASLHEEGVLDGPDAEPEPASRLEPRAGGEARDHALADIKREFQDALNRGDRPDVVGIVDERPDLKDEVAELSHFYNFLNDALKPDFPGPAPEPVQEVVLSHFRLVTMHARHPLGGLFLGVDQHTNRHAELLVIRGQFSKARSTRLLREALAPRGVADPGLVLVLDAGEVHDLRFVAWEYRSELSLDRVIRRLRRAGGHKTLRQILREHSDTSDPATGPKAPADEGAVLEAPSAEPANAAARLLANPAHVAEVLDLLATAGEALDRAHLRGLILADVRPANVFVDRRGAARLRGFGLVQHARAAWHRLGSDVTFLAPEVLADDEPPLDWRTDVWGLATIAYSAFALADPPDFASITERTERLFLDLRGAPEGLLPLLDRALDKDPANRPASCSVLAEEFRRMAMALTPPDHAPPPQPAARKARRAPILIVALVAVLGGVLIWLLSA